MRFHKAIYLFLILPFSLAFTSVSFDHSDFSGTWKLNVEASEFGKFPTLKATQRYSIQQKDNEMTVQRISTDSSGTVKEYTETYPFDTEKLSKIIRPYDGVIKYSRFKWNGESEFVLSSEYRLPADSSRTVQKSLETWTLSGDGKRCVISSQIQTTGETIKVVWVLDKIK